MSRIERGKVGGRGPFDQINTLEDFKSLVKNFPDLFELEGDVLYATEIPPYKPKDLPTVYIFGSKKFCHKCNCFHDENNEPRKRYDGDLNILRRFCRECDYEWIELCPDGTQPNFEYHLVDGALK